MITYMNIVDDLRFMFTCDIIVCFKLYTYLTITKKIIEIIML